jgi:hypothetical protein
MGHFDFTGRTAEELRAIAAEANRLADIGILPTDPEIQALENMISELAIARKITNEQVVKSIAEALGIKLENKGATKGGTRKKSLRDAMKEKLDKTYSNSVPTDQIATDYIRQYGHTDFEALKAQHPASTVSKL